MQPGGPCVPLSHWSVLSIVLCTEGEQHLEANRLYDWWEAFQDQVKADFTA